MIYAPVLVFNCSWPSKNMDLHSHNFSESEWPFADAINTTAFTTSRVLRDGFPVLLVSHDHDGDWQFLCDTTTDTADCKIVCLGCAYQLDKSVGDLADLPSGWMARRDSLTGPWDRYIREPDEEDS